MGEIEVQHTFECGCSFPIIGPPVGKSKIPLLDLNLDIETIRMDCPGTWQLISKGLTKGVFQLESNLGKQYAKKLRPENIEHMAALGSLLRPGSLRALDDKGISMTDHYCLRKNKEEETIIKYPELNEILGPTYDVIAYQEQCMQIAVKVAGFTEQESDNLRKCVTGDTYFVSKSRGWITIDKLIEDGYKDDLFLVMNESGEQFWESIEKIWCTGKHDVIEVESRTGLSVKATKHHQFLTDTGWKARSRLNLNDYLVTVNSVDYEGTDKIDEKLAFIIAGLLTEGYFVENNTPTFVNHDIEMMMWFVDNFNEYFKTSFSRPNKVFNIHKEYKEIIHKYMKYGLSGDKEIPSEMMGAKLETTRKFLSFMLGAEGGISKGAFEYSSKSKIMIKQVQLLLLRFGIRSNLLLKNDKKYGIYYRLYINNINDQRKILEQCLDTYWPKYKKEALLNLLNDGRVDNQFTLDIIPTTIVSKLLNQYPYVANYEGGSAYSRSLGKKRFNRFCIKSADQYWIDFSNGKQFYDKISSLDNKNRQKLTYDFTIKNNKTPYIIANGIVIHNSIGKKLPEEMAKVKTIFLEKGEKLGILSKEALDEVFGWIEKSQRYSFNKSHAVGYALNGYLSAYCKYHFPLQFYTSYLASSKDTQKPTEEIRELVNDTKLMKIEVKPHDIRMKNHDFVNDGEFIYFGLRNIKGVGESGCKNVSEILSLFDVANSKWFGILIQFSRLPSLFEKLILAGCFDFLGLQRQFMLYELRCLNKLSEGELDWIYYNAHRFTSLKEALVAALKPKYRTTKKKKDLGLLLTEIKPVDLDDYGAAATVKSVNKIKSIIRSLDNPPISLEDTVDFIVQNEEELLGVAITCSRIDDKNTYIANCTCSEFIKINQKNIIIAAEIQEVKVIKIKNGQNCGRQMAFLTVSDNTGSLPDITIFSDAYDKYKNMLQINNTIMLRGKKDYKRKCLIADEIYQL